MPTASRPTRQGAPRRPVRQEVRRVISQGRRILDPSDARCRERWRLSLAELFGSPSRLLGEPPPPGLARSRHFGVGAVAGSFGSLAVAKIKALTAEGEEGRSSCRLAPGPVGCGR
jgi:hypothetical protein